MLVDLTKKKGVASKPNVYVGEIYNEIALINSGTNFTCSPFNFCKDSPLRSPLGMLDPFCEFN